MVIDPDINKAYNTMYPPLVESALYYLTITFVFFIGCILLVFAVLYILDSTQDTNTIRRNYPLIGRFRYVFQHLGEFFRQYFFAMDREEMPFNRAIRNWVYNASQDKGNMLAFGSTNAIRSSGETLFANSPFPVLEENATESPPMVIGPTAPTPYCAPSIFNISGMSYGALSSVAVKALSKGAKLANCWYNTGEGGLSPYHLEGDCDIVFQIGTANYGVRNDDGELCPHKLAEVAQISNVKMFEIKLSQGAKPGKGGVLPAGKVNEEIAEIRGIPAWKASNSPNARENVHNNEDLLDLIAFVKQHTGKPVGIKFVLGDPTWIPTLCEAIVKRGAESAPDFITLDGAEGGTGAAPQPLLDFVGLSIQESLPILVDNLKQFDLRDHVRIIASGKMISPAYVAQAMAIGADFVVSARGFMFSLGCIQALKCNKNTCPTGITTHKKKYQQGLNPEHKAVRVANYHNNLVDQVNTIAHSCGAKHARELNRNHLRMVVDDGRTMAYKDYLNRQR